MPQAVTHILFPILLVSLFRDFYLRNKEKKNFPLHYVLFAGLGGVLPDIDIIFSIILNLAGIQDWNIHKTFTHSLFLPIIFVLIYFLLKPVHKKAKICNLTKHKLELSKIFLVLAVGISIHIFLDSIFGERAFFFYPILINDYGINLISYLSKDLQNLFFPTLDGILLVIWLVYLELKHKISDFI